MSEYDWYSRHGKPTPPTLDWEDTFFQRKGHLLKDWEDSSILRKKVLIEKLVFYSAIHETQIL